MSARNLERPLHYGEGAPTPPTNDRIRITQVSSMTGFATAAQQKITRALRLLMMQPAPVVRAGIRALQARRISVVPGWANKATVMFTRATPRWLHQAVVSRIMGAATDRGNASTASVHVARRKRRSNDDHQPNPLHPQDGTYHHG